MSHGYYPEGEGPGTDTPAQVHDRQCRCSICDYESEMEAEDNQYQAELAKFPPIVLRAVEIIAADHHVAHNDHSHRWWMAAVINKGACPLTMDNSLNPPSIQHKEEGTNQHDSPELWWCHWCKDLVEPDDKGMCANCGGKEGMIW